MTKPINNIHKLLHEFQESINKGLDQDELQEVHIQMLQTLNKHYRDHGKYPNNELMELHGMLVGRYGWILKSREISDEQFKKEEEGPCIW